LTNGKGKRSEEKKRKKAIKSKRNDRKQRTEKEMFIGLKIDRVFF
jgi:hypothetical protein